MTRTVPDLYPSREEQITGRLLGVDDRALWSVVTGAHTLPRLWGITGFRIRMFFGLRYGTDPHDYLNTRIIEADALDMETLTRHSPLDRVRFPMVRGAELPDICRIIPTQGFGTVYEAPAYVWLTRIKLWAESSYPGRGYLPSEEKEQCG